LPFAGHLVIFIYEVLWLPVQNL